jgi:hypothetical protein
VPHPIHAWEIWNEENNGFWWGSRVSPTGYAAVFAATRNALRTVDPQALAVVGGLVFTANGQSSYVAPSAMIGALSAGDANAFDAVAVHPYTDATGASATELADNALALIAEVAATIKTDTGPGPGGALRQQIWVTEMGWSSLEANPTTIASGLQDFFDLVNSGARSTYNIGPVLWYDLEDSSTLGTLDDQLGLRLTAADGADGGPTPAWNVFSQFAVSEGVLPLPPALATARPYVATGSSAPRTLASSQSKGITPKTKAAGGTACKLSTKKHRCAAKRHRKRKRHPKRKDSHSKKRATTTKTAAKHS